MERVLRIAAVALGVGIVALGMGWGYWVYTPSIEPVPALGGELYRGSVRVGEMRRRFRWYRPAKPAPAPALVFVLHGSNGDGKIGRRSTYYEFDRLADRHGFFVAYPDGYERHWNDCNAAATFSANTREIDDVAFIAQLIDLFLDQQRIDERRVYAAGISNGGQMSYRLALELPDRIAAIAAVAASLPAEANFDCKKSGRALPVLVMNGTADPMNPYEGGPAALYGFWRNSGEVRSTEATVAYFARLAGHRGAPRVVEYADVAVHDDSRAELRRYRDGRRGPEVVLIAVHGGGHSFPHPFHRFPRFLGATNADLDAAAEIWRFFADKRL